MTETLTEHKYRGSIEKVGKTIRVYTTNKGLEALALFELVIFCFIAGNADMHLKNFSVIRFDNGEIRLSPLMICFLPNWLRQKTWKSRH